MDVPSPGRFAMSFNPSSILWGGPRLNPRPYSFQHISDLWKMLLGSPRHLNPANSPPLRKTTFSSLLEPVVHSSRSTVIAKAPGLSKQQQQLKHTTRSKTTPFSVSWDVTRVAGVSFSPEPWCLQRLFTSSQEV